MDFFVCVTDGLFLKTLETSQTTHLWEKGNIWHLNMTNNDIKTCFRRCTNQWPLPVFTGKFNNTDKSWCSLNKPLALLHSHPCSLLALHWPVTTNKVTTETSKVVKGQNLYLQKETKCSNEVLTPALSSAVKSFILIIWHVMKHFLHLESSPQRPILPSPVSD